MNNQIKKVIDWVQTKGKQIPNSIMEMMGKLNTKSTISVSNLASIIIYHPNTEIRKDNWLGLTFHVYKLKIGNLTFYLETKGKNNDYILMCQVFDENGLFSEYKSYEKVISINDQIKIPLIDQI
ncbi:hypothetical protein M3196_06080 [Fictibacillus nanhaiensis]|uniref:hypothetical protein n=1 Tax=Fictibacillus nanhaiensis TaxID=742169 RepID=UPI00203C4210|nr:hypothetical protein [Fictibacillus nanhaiensis]MCM3731227.1 hypothetical protein [Fictibacillus nanhaiensis]